MKLTTAAQARTKVETALRAADIDGPGELRYAIATMTAVEALAVAMWISEAWSNGYRRGSDAVTLPHVFSPPPAHEATT